MSNQNKGRVGQMQANSNKEAEQAAAQEQVKQDDVVDAAAQAGEAQQAPAAPTTTQEPADKSAEAPVAEQAPAQEAPAATAAVTETTTLAAAATSSLATRGTIAPPRVRRDNANEQKSAPALPNTLRPEAVPAQRPVLIEEVQRILKDVPPTNHFPVLAVVEYCEKADLKRSNDAKTLAHMNVGLWRNITNLINRQEEHFDPLFTALLRIFHLESKNAMAEIAINRGIEHMALSKQELAGYMNITTLLRLVADPKSRKQVIKTGVNVPAALRNGLTQEGIARVIAYFETH